MKPVDFDGRQHLLAVKGVSNGTVGAICIPSGPLSRPITLA